MALVRNRIASQVLNMGLSISLDEDYNSSMLQQAVKRIYKVKTMVIKLAIQTLESAIETFITCGDRFASFDVFVNPSCSRPSSSTSASPTSASHIFDWGTLRPTRRDVKAQFNRVPKKQGCATANPAVFIISVIYRRSCIGHEELPTRSGFGLPGLKRYYGGRRPVVLRRHELKWPFVGHLPLPCRYHQGSGNTALVPRAAQRLHYSCRVRDRGRRTICIPINLVSPIRYAPVMKLGD